MQTYSPARLAEVAIARSALQDSSELAGLVDFLQRREPPRTVLEIGTARGGTLWLWCRLAAEGALIVSVDLPGGPFGGGYTMMDIPRFRSYAQPGQTLKLVAADSHDPLTLEAVRGFLPGPWSVDLLFIDGDHTLAGVTKDWDMYGPLVAPGGLVVFHDITDHTAEADCDCNVKDLWDRLKEGYEHYEFCTPGLGWGGIGVLRKP
jgi:predicted O-methyltransferase YrrM